MKTYEVFNEGKKTRSRLGITFKPKKRVEVDATARQYFVLNATKDFKVKEVKEEETPKEYDEDGEESSSSFDADKDENELSEETVEILQGSTIDDFIEFVKDKDISISKAIEVENNGKARATLLKELEKMAGD